MLALFLQVSALLLALACALAQEATIVIPIENKQFKLNFNVRAPANDVAREFCVQQAGELTLTQETLPVCVGQVSKFIGNAVAETFNTAKVRLSTDIIRFSILYCTFIAHYSKTQLLCKNTFFLYYSLFVMLGDCAHGEG